MSIYTPNSESNVDKLQVSFIDIYIIKKDNLWCSFWRDMRFAPAQAKFKI